MSNNPLTLPNTFANQSGTIQLALLDQNFTPLANALNSLSQYSNYFLDTSGAANAITVTVAAPLTFGYTAGIQLQVKIANTNTSGTVVINVNALGNKSVVNPDGSNPGVGQLVLGGVYTLIFDGTNFQVENGAAGSLSAAAFANPSGTIGLTAVNGSATTAMRSDGAPALSQGISPTWSGTHTFSNAITVNAGGSTLKGGVSVTAPASSAAALTVSGTAGTFAASAAVILGSSTTGQSNGLFIAAGTNASDTALRVQNQAQSTNYLVVQGNGAIFAGPSSNLQISANGNVSVAAPSSGNTFATTGLAGSVAALFTGSSTSGSSFGVAIDAGTTSADYALQVANQSAATTYFRVRGDGVVFGNDGTNIIELGYKDIPQNAQTTNYALALSDRGKGVDFNGTSLTCTIPANASVAFPVGATIVVTNLNASNLSIAITTDTLTLAATTTTGTRTVAQNGMCTLRKTGTTNWMATGPGVS